MAFAEVHEVATLLNRSFTEGEEAQLEMLLEHATAEIRAAAGATISLVEDDEVVLLGTWGRDVELPERPVTAVTSISVNDEVQGEGSWVWNGGQLVRRSGAFQGGEFDESDFWPEELHQSPGWQGAGWEQGAHWGGPASSVAVTYTHGYAEVPTEIKALCMQLAISGMATSTGNVRQETVGAYSVTYDTSGVTISDRTRRRLRARYGTSSGTIRVAR